MFTKSRTKNNKKNLHLNLQKNHQQNLTLPTPFYPSDHIPTSSTTMYSFLIFHPRIRFSTTLHLLKKRLHSIPQSSILKPNFSQIFLATLPTKNSSRYILTQPNTLSTFLQNSSTRTISLNRPQKLLFTKISKNTASIRLYFKTYPRTPLIQTTLNNSRAHLRRTLRRHHQKRIRPNIKRVTLNTTNRTLITNPQIFHLRYKIQNKNTILSNKWKFRTATNN